MGVLYPGGIGIWSVGFDGERKTGEPGKNPRSKDENQQQTQPTYETTTAHGLESNPPRHICGGVLWRDFLLFQICSLNFCSMYNLKERVSEGMYLSSRLGLRTIKESRTNNMIALRNLVTTDKTYSAGVFSLNIFL